MVGAAWLALVLWGASPAGRYLHHAEGSSLVGVLLFDLGWMLMIVAMMLPTTTGLLRAFHPVAGPHANARMLIVAVSTGYVVAWTAAGHLLRSADVGVHAAVAGWTWLDRHSHLVAAGIFVVAGAYQWTPLKHRCLTKCRTPRSFVYRYWRRRPVLDAVSIGLAYGVSCVGCCWALMLLLFAVGSGSLAWMLMLGAVMAVEKNVRGGTRISTPLGAVLVGTGVVQAVGV